LAGLVRWRFATHQLQEVNTIWDRGIVSFWWVKKYSKYFILADIIGASENQSHYL
jgi:hypothetical protein